MVDTRLEARAQAAIQAAEIELAEAKRLQASSRRLGIGQTEIRGGPPALEINHALLAAGAAASATGEVARALTRLRQLFDAWKGDSKRSERIKLDLDLQIGVVEEKTSKLRGLRLRARASRDTRWR